MRTGFYSPAELSQVKQPLSLIPKCGQCNLYKTCRSPKMPVTGKGYKKILIVGEAPGKNEDDQNRQFCGDSGELLERTLHNCGIDMRRDCWITNSLICRPKNNRTPKPKEIEYCRPNLINTIREKQPETFILLGKIAVQSLIGYLWKENVGPITRWVGWKIPCQMMYKKIFNTWVYPTYHPSYVIRTKQDKRSDLTGMFFERHLQQATQLRGRPWQQIADYPIQRLLDIEEGISKLKLFLKTNIPLCFDLETDRLKPQSMEATIISVAISNGLTTIACPWTSGIKKVMKEILLSNIPKIGWNIRFEENWIRKSLGIPVNNWIWDGMLASHVLDNRKGITGLKFQSFVQLGVESYEESLKPYMKSRSNERNRLKEFVDNKGWDVLLKYNGLDAIYEHKICMMQMEQMGFKL